ncbi:MAG: hypothetical protein ACLVJO_03940 [[Clostridium] scindens]
MNQFNWDTSFHVDFDLVTGLSKTAETTKRYLSQMKDMYYDADAVNEVLKAAIPWSMSFMNWDVRSGPRIWHLELRSLPWNHRK